MNTYIFAWLLSASIVQATILTNSDLFEHPKPSIAKTSTNIHVQPPALYLQMALSRLTRLKITANCLQLAVCNALEPAELMAEFAKAQDEYFAQNKIFTKMCEIDQRLRNGEQIALKDISIDVARQMWPSENNPMMSFDEFIAVNEGIAKAVEASAQSPIVPLNTNIAVLN